MRIVITGSSGRIGRAIHARLAGRHQVVGLDRVPAPTTQVVCDLLDAGRVRAALVGADAVVHAAALHARHVGQESDAEFRRVNVEGTRTVAGAAIAVGVSRFVYTSTTALYGSAIDPVADGYAAWIDEGVTPRPRTIYHETKLRAEQVVRSYGEAGALAVTILRMSRCFPEPVPEMAMYRLYRGLDERDAASAHERAIESLARGGARLFVISAPTPFEPRDCELLARDAPAVLRRRVPGLVAAFERRGWGLPAVIDRVYDSRLAERTLGWRAEHGPESLVAPDVAGAGEAAAAL
ncbi:MAG: NAD(P)-dependent oxidoreductase [Steroidobacteraceae bacterium]|jgi:nucleoside-diphosphate-sugar epimerase|nr:NAD(P)-dependent oxidoreductase [Steroidobacteraceae bacterium]